MAKPPLKAGHLIAAYIAEIENDPSDHSMGVDDGRLAELDWLTSPRSETLHAPRLQAPITNPWNHPIYRVACGRVMKVSIPGIFSRMGRERCKQCCKNRGYPEGTGSPKNDAACRVILGLEPTNV